jgi:hypothetical protein
MALLSTFTGSRSIALTAIFAAMIAVLDAIPHFGFYTGVWDSWGFLLSPIVGIVLGPILGAISVGLGGLVGHMIYFRDPLELVFMIGAPIGAAMASLVYEQKWKPVVSLYSLLLLGYFLTPVTWVLSLLGIWDVLTVFALTISIAGLSYLKHEHSPILNSTSSKLILASIIGLEIDILVRIFILVPGQFWWLFYGFSVPEMQGMWLVAGVITPIKVILSSIATIAIGKSLMLHFNQQDLRLIVE